VLVREGSRLSQLRLRRGHSALDADELAALHTRERLVDSEDADFEGGISVSVDLAGSGPNSLIGYRAKRHTGVIDVERRARYDFAGFYEKMLARPDSLYGQGIGSNYQAQGLKLSKHFKV